MNKLKTLIKFLKHLRSLTNYRLRNYRSPSPEFIKHDVMKSVNLPNSLWIETGTYYGETTDFLSNISERVISIEADKDLYNLAIKKFKKKNIEIVFGKSQEKLEEILNLNLKFQNVYLFLDAHSCNNHILNKKTFTDEDMMTPILQELEIVKKFFIKFNQFFILIDDIRLFSKNYQNYPPLKKIIDWCENQNFTWTIEHDILIANYLRIK